MNVDKVWTAEAKILTLKAQIRSPSKALISLSQCHAEGGATKGGVSKREQTQTNADKRWQTQANAEAKTQANASKRGQTQTNAYTPLYCGFLQPPFAIP